MKAIKLINTGSFELKKNHIVSHQLDAEILLSKTLNKTREKILVNLDQMISKKNVVKFKKLIKRRSEHEPIAYIIKEKEFWSKKFFVDKNILIPRPETELLVQKLVDLYKEKKIFILDIGTGSGCILISLLSELKKANGVGIDISKKSIYVAKKNASKHKMFANIKFYNKSLENLFNQNFDLIVSNPPYIKRKDLKNLSEDIKKYEPKIALDGGNDGLDVIKKVIYKAKSILKTKGTLALEIGNGQFKKVSEILIKNNFKIEHIISDYKNNIRSLVAVKK